MYPVIDMKNPPAALHCSLLTSASAGNGTSIWPLANFVHTLLCRCQWSLGPAKPSGASPIA